MTSPNDADLVARARQGDQAAYSLLVEQHQQAVFRFAYLLLRDRGDADDVAQETFIRAFRALDRFDLTRPLRPWLLSITANLARNRWRSARRYVAMVQRLGRSHDDDRRQDERDELHQWQARAVHDAIARLEHDDREIIYLRYFLDMSVEETAQALNVASGTVKSRLHRALGRLRVVAHQIPILSPESPDA